MRIPDAKDRNGAIPSSPVPSVAGHRLRNQPGELQAELAGDDAHEEHTQSEEKPPSEVGPSHLSRVLPSGEQVHLFLEQSPLSREFILVSVVEASPVDLKDCELRVGEHIAFYADVVSELDGLGVVAHEG